MLKKLVFVAVLLVAASGRVNAENSKNKLSEFSVCYQNALIKSMAEIMETSERMARAILTQNKDFFDMADKISEEIALWHLKGEDVKSILYSLKDQVPVGALDRVYQCYDDIYNSNIDNEKSKIQDENSAKYQGESERNFGMVAIGARADGPFGFTWGSSIASSPIEYISEVDLINQDSAGRGIYYECKKAIINDMFDSNYGASYQSYINIEDTNRYSQNIEGADVSIEGKVSAYIFSVDYYGSKIDLCAAFFEDNLFMLHFFDESLIVNDVYSKFRVSLDDGYRKHNYCYDDEDDTICKVTWTDDAKRIEIVENGGFTYNFAPVKWRQIKAWVDIYNKAVFTNPDYRANK